MIELKIFFSYETMDDKFIERQYPTMMETPEFMVRDNV